jgi:hypothetical protein
MHVFTDSLGYQLFDVIAVRVTAKNEKGSSPLPSATSTAFATVKTIPQAMAFSSITRDSSTTENLVIVDWQPLVTSLETGDSAILSYNLQYDQGIDSWVSIVGESTFYTLTSATVTDLAKGLTYQFKIQALNIYGWSPEQTMPFAQVKAAEEPR